MVLTSRNVTQDAYMWSYMYPIREATLIRGPTMVSYGRSHNHERLVRGG